MKKHNVPILRLVDKGLVQIAKRGFTVWAIEAEFNTLSDELFDP